MQEELDTVSLSDVIGIYKEISSMVKSLEDKEKAIEESGKNA